MTDDVALRILEKFATSPGAGMRTSLEKGTFKLSFIGVVELDSSEMLLVRDLVRRVMALDGG